jgi:hypothetical protein
MGDALILGSYLYPLLLVGVICAGQYDLEKNDYVHTEEGRGRVGEEKNRTRKRRAELI